MQLFQVLSCFLNDLLQINFVVFELWVLHLKINRGPYFSDKKNVLSCTIRMQRTKALTIMKELCTKQIESVTLC